MQNIVLLILLILGCGNLSPFYFYFYGYLSFFDALLSFGSG